MIPLVRKLRSFNRTLSHLQYSYFKLFRHRLTTGITRRRTRCPTTSLIDVSRTLDRKCCVVSNPLHRGVQILTQIHQSLLAAVARKAKCIIAVSPRRHVERNLGLHRRRRGCERGLQELSPRVHGVDSVSAVRAVGHGRREVERLGASLRLAVVPRAFVVLDGRRL